MGGLGSIFVSANKVFMSAEKVKAVDTTGAGDAYIGSIAYFLASEHRLKPQWKMRPMWRR
jgi:ribokinase